MNVTTSVTTSGEIVLAPATLDQADDVAAVWHAGWRDGHLGHVPDELLRHRTPADFHRRTVDRLGAMTTAVAAQHDGEPVVGFHVVRGDEVEQLYVDAQWRGSGVAAALLAHAEQAIGRGHATAWLAVAPGNSRARRFYERCGWHDAGAFDNPADTNDGVMLVPTRRYEKRLRSQEKRA